MSTKEPTKMHINWRDFVHNVSLLEETRVGKLKKTDHKLKHVVGERIYR